MNDIAVIGSGISGLSIAHLLKNHHNVVLFEKDDKPGGLIKCNTIDGNLYHMVGGHCFNSKRDDVLEWFWKFFDKEMEFTRSRRNAVAMLDKPIGYPIENHLYQMDPKTVTNIIYDFVELIKSNKKEYENFEDFLKSKFGKTLYELYFKPYNEKIWKKKLSEIPLTWLEGKLPMPDISEILTNNINKKKESEMVHSSFYYPKKNGSQFIADSLSKDIDIRYCFEVNDIYKDNIVNKWVINNKYKFDSIVFTGNIKILPSIFKNNYLSTELVSQIDKFDYHGTTTVLCEIDKNDYSWIYMPSISYDAHRIICTGNFSSNNNKKGILSGTLEFTDELDKNQIKSQLKKIPFNPRYITHTYTKYTYPIQDIFTKDVINGVKEKLESKGFYILGRFAEWEYYNMDTAIGAAMDLSKKINKK